MPDPTIVTTSSLRRFRECPRAYWYAYEMKLRPREASKALRMGSMYHKGLEYLNQGFDLAQAVGLVRVAYEQMPAHFDPYWWQVERETVCAMIAGHHWRYGADIMEVVAAEQVFYAPIINPETGRASPLFIFGGKQDKMGRLSTSRLALNEYKTTNEDVGPDSDYWLRLPADPQTSGYFVTAAGLGYDVGEILWDAARKPGIAPRQIPLLDAEGEKIVLDDRGARVFTKVGKPRQTGDVGLGYTLQCRPETPEEFGQRLIADMGERPDFYFGRREIPKLWDEIDAFRYELWQQIQTLKTVRESGRWYRNVGKNTCGFCDYATICLHRVTLNPDIPPNGFEYLASPHPELEIENAPVACHPTPPPTDPAAQANTPEQPAPGNGG